MDEVVASAPSTGQPTPTHAVPRDVRHSVEYAADRIAGLMGASEPTDPPSDEQPTPSHEAAPEASEPAPETGEAEPSTSESPTEAPEAPAELPSTLDELAQAFEVPVEKIRDIKVTAKIDGEEVEVTLADAIAGYQRTQDYTRKTTELSEQRAEFERAVQEAEAELQTRVQSLASATQALRQQIIGQEPNWKALLNDPVKFNAAKLEWEQRNAAFTKAIQTHQAEAQRAQAQQQQAFQAHLAAEREKMVKNWPELADPEGSAAKEVKTYLREAGFSDQDIGGIVDHRMIAVIKDAIKGRSVSTAVPEKKLVKPKPRATVSPGPASGVVDPKAQKLAAARRNAKRNPKDMKSHADRFRLILGT